MADLAPIDPKRRCRGGDPCAEFFDAAGDPFCILDAGGRFVRVNPAFEALLGWSCKAVHGRHLRSFVHPGDIETAATAMSAAWGGEAVSRFVMRGRRRDGGYRWLEWGCRAPRANDLIFATVRDVTAQLSAEGRRKTLESASGMASWDLEAGTLAMRWSEGLYGLLGVGPECDQPSLADLLAQVSPDYRPTLELAFDRLLKDGAPFDVDMRLATGSGAERDVRITGMAERRAGEVARAYGAVVDVTKARAERRHVERLAEVAAKTGKIVVVCNAAGQIDWVNATFEDRTGYTLAEARGRRSDDLLTFEGTDPATVAAIHAARVEGRAMTCEILKRGKTGDPFWVQIDLKPIYDGDALSGSISIETDITRAKADRRSLAEAEARERATIDVLLAAIEALPDGFVLFDADDRLVLCNAKYREIYPRSAFAMTPGVRFEDLIRAGVARGEYVDAIGREEAWIAERLACRRVSADGFEQHLTNGRWLRIVERRTPDGGRVGLRIDITRVKEAERRLAEIIAAADAGTWEWNVQTGETIVNEGWARIIGYRLEDLGPISIETWKRSVHPVDLAASLPKLEACLSGIAEAYECDVRMRHKAGHWVCVLVRGRVMTRKADGRPEWMFGIHIDVTERRRLQEALVAERDMFETLMATSAAAIVATDNEGRVAFANEAAGQLFEVSARDSIGRTQGEFDFHAENLDGSWRVASESSVARVAMTGQPVRNDRFAVVLPSGRRRIVSVNATPVDAPSTRVQVVSVYTDVTEEAAAEAALRRALLQAEAANKAKSEFLSVMSHELRTPLNGVLGLADILKHKLHDPDLRHLAETIRESGDQLLSIVTDMLEYAQVEAGGPDHESAPFDPADVVRQVAARYRKAAAAKGLALVTRCEATSRIGDPRRIAEMIARLVSNAIKFTHSGSVTLRVTAAETGATVFEVSDTGVGMTADQLEHIFDPFWQADSSTTRKFGGVGLGLTVVQRIVEVMDGTIEVQSRPGEGTTVRVEVPLPAGEHAGVRRVVVVGLPDCHSTVLKGALGRLGCVAIMVGSGLEAAEAVREKSPDAVMLAHDGTGHDAGIALWAIRAVEQALERNSAPAIAIDLDEKSGCIPPCPDGFVACLTWPPSIDGIANVLDAAIEENG